MIRYSLSCSGGHGFEAWFASSEAFDTQRAGDAVACPVCGTTHVEKALMAPAVATGRKGESVPVAAPAEQPAELVEMMRKVRQHLTANADYVGDRFADEARRIHYEETEKRGIYGEATKDEVRALIDDGIECHPLPVLPEDHN